LWLLINYFKTFITQYKTEFKQNTIILTVILDSFKTWTLSLKKEHIIIFEKKTAEGNI